MHLSSSDTALVCATARAMLYLATRSFASSAAGASASKSKTATLAKQVATRLIGKDMNKQYRFVRALDTVCFFACSAALSRRCARGRESGAHVRLSASAALHRIDGHTCSRVVDIDIGERRASAGGVRRRTVQHTVHDFSLTRAVLSILTNSSSSSSLSLS